MRGASTVTWLAASVLMAGCATQASAPLPVRAPIVPIALTQEGAAPYRWIVCDAGQDCRRPTAKTVATITLPRLSQVQQSRPQAVVQPLQLVQAAETTSMVAPESVLPSNTKTLVVNFAVNSSVLDTSARSTLDELRMIGANTVQVRGYTDSTGPTEYNTWLAERRAQRVKEYVIRAGVEPEQVRMEAMGECCFVASNGTPEGRFANRRVEVVINGR